MASLSLHDPGSSWEPLRKEGLGRQVGKVLSGRAVDRGRAGIVEK